MTRTTSHFLLIAATALIAVPGTAQTMRSLEEKVEEAWGNVTTFTAELTMETYIPVEEDSLTSVGVGSFEFMKAEPRDKYRQHMFITVPPPAAMEAAFEYLFDGEALYLMNELQGETTIAKVDDPELNSGALPPGGKPLLDALAEELRLKTAGEASIDGNSVYVMIGGRRDPAPDDPVHKAVVYIDKANGIQRRAEFFDAEDNLHTRITYTDIRLNIRIPKERFVYSAPQPAPAE